MMCLQLCMGFVSDLCILLVPDRVYAGLLCVLLVPDRVYTGLLFEFLALDRVYDDVSSVGARQGIYRAAV